MRDEYDRTDRRARDDRRPRPARYASPRPSGGTGPLGVIALVMGILSLVVSALPCVGAVAIPVAVIALVFAAVAFAGARRARQDSGVPVAAFFVSGAAVSFALLWVVLFGVVVGGGEHTPAPRQVAAVKPAPPAPPAVKPNAALKKSAGPKLDDEQFEKKLLEDLAKDRVQEAIRNGPGLAVTAAKLEADYAANVVAADVRYKDKVLAVSGKVVRVARDESKGTYTLELATDGATKPVRCEFAERAKHMLAAVAPGQQVAVRGQCAGRADEAVRLKDCVLAK